MNKKILIPIALVVLVVIFLYTSTNKSSDSDNLNSFESDSMENVNSSDGDSFTGKITDLLSLGKNLRCDFSAKNEEFEITGISYVAGEKMRTDMTYISEKIEESTGMKNYSSSMISDGEYTYMWSDLTEQGFKTQMGLDDAKEMAENSQELADKYENFPNTDIDYDYDCDPWIVDDSKFTPPTDIEFIDFQAQLEGMKQILDQNSDYNACDACQYLSGESKQSCLKSLGC